MESRDFTVIKTEQQFQRNYSLHDIAEKAGTEILKSKGYSTIPFGEDRRNEYVWENGKDKPDCFIMHSQIEDKKICLLDWKGKATSGYIINERAYNSYLKICAEMSLPLIIAMAKIDETSNKILSFVYFVLPNPKILVITKTDTAWDENKTVKFDYKYRVEFECIGSYLDKLSLI